MIYMIKTGIKTGTPKKHMSRTFAQGPSGRDTDPVPAINYLKYKGVRQTECEKDNTQTDSVYEQTQYKQTQY